MSSANVDLEMQPQAQEQMVISPGGDGSVRTTSQQVRNVSPSFQGTVLGSIDSQRVP